LLYSTMDDRGVSRYYDDYDRHRDREWERERGRVSPRDERSKSKKSKRRHKSSSRSPDDRSKRKKRSRSRSKRREKKKNSRSDSLKRETSDTRGTKRFKESGRSRSPNRSPRKREQARKEEEEVAAKAAEEKRINRILKARALATIDLIAENEENQLTDRKDASQGDKEQYQPFDSLEADDDEGNTVANRNGNTGEEDDDDDDPLAAFMNSIKGEIVAQVGMTTENLQTQAQKPIGTITFEEIQSLTKSAPKIDEENENVNETSSSGNQGEIEGEGAAKSDSQELTKAKDDNEPSVNDQSMKTEKTKEEEVEDDEESEDEEDYHKKFMESIRNADKSEAVNEDINPSRVQEDPVDTKREEKALPKKEAREHRYFDDDEDDYMLDYHSGDDDGDDFFAKRKKFEEKKDLKPVDHSIIEYEPFRKNFWIEPPEIAALTKEEVVKLRLDLNNIKVRGRKPPRPITDWYQCGLRNLVMAVIKKKDYKQPTPVQCQSIPAIMSGRDVIGIAETGSGKTLAFLLPMFRHILDQRPLEEGDGPIALIMTPTRELANQIYTECELFCRALDLNVIAVYGGASIGPQLSALRRGAEIVVCTPGRMIEVLCLNNGKLTNLQRITYVVLDEADRMFDMGFEPQISRIIGNIRPKRQTVMFSATFEKHVESLAKKILNQPIEIVVGNRGQTCTNVEQFVEVREEREKFLRLLELLGTWSGKGQILIFVERQIEADELYKELLKMGYYPLVLHGGQDQTDRDFTISDFKRGIRDLMIATSVCARGLDVRSLVLVINFSCPNHVEDYVHRVGRTGRAGNKGTAHTFITPEQGDYAHILLKALKLGENTIPEELQKLADTYQEQVNRGEKEFHKHNVRQGKGYKFDKAERDKVKKERNLIKKQYDLGDSDEEEEEAKSSDGEDREDNSDASDFDERDGKGEGRQERGKGKKTAHN